MPLMLPKQRGITRESNATGRPTTTWGTALTSDTVAHTLPAAYTDLIASTSYDSDWVNVWFHTNNGANMRTDSLVTIYVGAASSEQVLIPTLLAGYAGSVPNTVPAGRWYSFPLHVPAGSRISARHQSVRTSTAVYCMIELLGGGRADHWTGTRVECVGADTANSCGTSVTPGTTSDGTLTSIGTNSYEWGHAQATMGGNVTDTSLNTGTYVADLASSSSTANLITGLDNFMFMATSAEIVTQYGPTGRFCTVPASTTLYLRAQTSAVAEAQDWCIYGVT